jgi:hypothetical protein
MGAPRQPHVEKCLPEVTGMRAVELHVDVSVAAERQRAARLLRRAAALPAAPALCLVLTGIDDVAAAAAVLHAAPDAATAGSFRLRWRRSQTSGMLWWTCARCAALRWRLPTARRGAAGCSRVTELRVLVPPVYAGPVALATGLVACACATRLPLVRLHVANLHIGLEALPALQSEWTAPAQVEPSEYTWAALAMVSAGRCAEACSEGQRGCNLAHLRQLTVHHSCSEIELEHSAASLARLNALTARAVETKLMKIMAL